MPLNQDWRRRFALSSADLGALRERWAEAGRLAWEAGTRAGRDVQARTQQELERLGRNVLAQAQQEQATARAQTQAVQSGLRTGAKVVRDGVSIMKDVAKQTPRAIADGVRDVDDVLTIPSHMMRRGDRDDPGPKRLVLQWAAGTGPQTRTLGPDSTFSREFAPAPSVQDFVRETIAAAPDASVYQPRGRADFGVTEFLQDARADNGASHVIGTFGLKGERAEDRINWTADNDMSLRSALAGRYLNKAGLRIVPNPRRPFPFGTTHQTVQFSTGLDGRPLR